MIVRRALDVFGFVFAFTLSEAFMVMVIVLLPVTWIVKQSKKVKKGRDTK